MKVVVIGGTGLIGSKVVAKLNAHGHEAVPASPDSGVNTLTGEGLADALVGADVVVDVSNSPSFADDDVLHFFRTSTGNLLAAETVAGVGHHVALSVVGSEKVPDSGYLRAKVAQEQLIKESGVPFSLVHATQFFEFVGAIADAGTVDGSVHIAPVSFQPVAAEDVATLVARTAAGSPLHGVVETGGPERVRFDEFIRNVLAERGDQRAVVTDPDARYFGAVLRGAELVPGPGATIAETTFAAWTSHQAAAVR
ncbi:SDR family oxidoreductase [Nocardioides immobilis]|uniref:SDR family oxidoreductase n=1 Tax=Nocardioides immobilis TaxID=2049295 RepID=A0A417Y1B1_9ACTN|nr:SDR family oxidoreductase [Nocardioides immobilis]RHW26449.1 SDR family oxidoreductase [Nocardioides immobilis]